MNVTQVDPRGAGTSSRRPARLAVVTLGVAGVGLLGLAVLDGARLELVLASLGLIAGAALVALLAD